MLHFYLNKLHYLNIPKFLNKYLESPSLLRLKKIGYFCGMDYASKDIYNFSEYISRYDHSLTVALLTYKLTKNNVATIAGLFHDIATPCFSHVIDYMNEDYEKQESTEQYTENVIMKDEYLKKCLKEDNINVKDIINFKKFTIVDNDRPKLCADRIDGVILTGIGWTKNITKDDINNIIDDLTIYKNKNNEDEIGFKSLNIAKKVIEVSETIDTYCHSNEDNYMMQLLAKITKYAINKKYISYDDLYIYNEEKIYNTLKKINDIEIKKYINDFETIKIKNIPVTKLSNVKIRELNPIINGKRFK